MRCAIRVSVELPHGHQEGETLAREAMIAALEAQGAHFEGSAADMHHDQRAAADEFHLDEVLCFSALRPVVFPGEVHS